MSSHVSSWMSLIIIFLQVLTAQMMIVPVKVMKCRGNKYGYPLTVILITTLSGEKTIGQCVNYLTV